MVRQWLKNIRTKANMSTYDVAKAAGISQSYYSALENGKRGKPLNVNIAKKIAKVFNIDWKRFYEGGS